MSLFINIAWLFVGGILTFWIGVGQTSVADCGDSDYGDWRHRHQPGVLGKKNLGGFTRRFSPPPIPPHPRGITP